MTRRVNSPYSKWHGQVFTFTPATNDPSYLVSAPPNSLVFHESELGEVEEQQGMPRSAIDQIKQELRDIIERAEHLTADWVVKSQQRELGQSGEFETETYIEDTRGFCVVNGWNLEERDENNFSFIAASRNLTPKMARALLGVIEWLELYAIPTEDAQAQLETIRREWEVQA